MDYKIIEYLPNQVRLQLTWNERCFERSTIWIVYLDGTYDFFKATFDGIVDEPSKEIIAYAVSKINTEFQFKLIVNPAMSESDKTIEYEFKTQAELNASRNSLADMLLFLQDEIAIMPDYSNYFIEQRLIDGFWIDVDEFDD